MNKFVKIEGKKPMMSDTEIAVIDKILEDIKPKICLEWGSGNSTIWFSRHKSIKSWLAIEHNGHYAGYLQNRVKPNTQVIWVSNEWYVDSVKLQGRRYDFILIDGKDREACLSVALNLIKPGGIILLHDAGRQEYQELILNYSGRKLTEGEIPVAEGGFAHRGLAAFTS